MIDDNPPPPKKQNKLQQNTLILICLWVLKLVHVMYFMAKYKIKVTRYEQEMRIDLFAAC